VRRSGRLAFLAPVTGYETVLIHPKNHLGMLALVFPDHLALEFGQAILAIVVPIAGMYPFRHLLPRYKLLLRKTLRNISHSLSNPFFDKESNGNNAQAMPSRYFHASSWD
jgi:hypothetical protein